MCARLLFWHENILQKKRKCWRKLVFVSQSSRNFKNVSIGTGWLEYRLCLRICAMFSRSKSFLNSGKDYQTLILLTFCLKFDVWRENKIVFPIMQILIAFPYFRLSTLPGRRLSRFSVLRSVRQCGRGWYFKFHGSIVYSLPRKLSRTEIGHINLFFRGKHIFSTAPCWVTHAIPVADP